MAIAHLDRPTDLKNALVELDITSEENRQYFLDSLDVLRKYPLVLNDLRLAYLRAICGTYPSEYATIISEFPEVLDDSRAVISIQLYKNRTLNQFLGIENEIEEEQPSSVIYAFDDSMFEHIDYTQFESKFDDDFGLIEYADFGERTLNQLRDRIQAIVLREGIESTNALLQDLQKYLIRYEYSNRAISDFFVASLRALGDIENELGVVYAKKFLGTVPDHRGMRSLVIYLRRKGDYIDALKILHHPKFKHDLKTVEWVNDLTALHKEMLLDGKLKSKYDEFLKDWANLEDYMDSLYESMDNDIEIARYNYSYALRVHKSNTDRPLSSCLIKWGGIILRASSTYSDTVSIHVSNAHINLGQISKAIEVLRNHSNPNSARISSKIRGYLDLLDLKNNGLTVDLDHIKSSYVPIPGRVVYVLHNSLPYNSGGYATRSHGLMCGVKKLGWDVQVITRRGYPHDRQGMQNLPTDNLQIVEDIPYHRLIELEKGYGQTNIASYLQSYAEDLARKVIELRPAIIHAASNHLNGLVANAIAKHFSIPSIYEVRGLWEITRISRQPEFKDSEYFQMMSNLETASASEATYIFAITTALGEEMEKRSSSIQNVGFLPNGVHSNRFVPKPRNLELKSKLGMESDTIVLGYIGSLVSYEGLDLLLEALPVVKRETNADFKMMIVGDGAYMDKLQTLCTNLGLDNDVIFAGRVPHEEVEDYYSIVDIAPFPRLPLPVTEMVSPLKPFEAMAMEKAVLASNVDALKEIVSHKNTGLLFSKGDSDDLSSKIIQLLENQTLRLDLGKKARIWVEENRDWSIISNALNDVYISLSG
tara:strand:+ start:300 stop:2759 length:2460 start_codon:yes stop_codon:yes gene_type:complete